jgi:hypothetical protein
VNGVIGQAAPITVSSRSETIPTGLAEIGDVATVNF